MMFKRQFKTYFGVLCKLLLLIKQTLKKFDADNLYELKNTVLELLEDHVTTFHFRNYMINKLL